MDRRVWYIVLAVVVVLILAYLLGLFGSTAVPVTAPTSAPATTAPVTPAPTTTAPVTPPAATDPAAPATTRP